MKKRMLSNLLIGMLIFLFVPFAHAEVPQMIAEFSTVDIYGNPQDQSLIQNVPLTFVNIWGTLCPPCIDEMPVLGKLADEFAGQVQFIGIVGDVNYGYGVNEELVELAIEIAEDTGAANYVHLVPSDELIARPLSAIEYYPTSFFVDSEGYQFAAAYIGSRDEAAWREIIQSALDELSADSTS